MTFRPKHEPSVERVFSEAERTAIYDVVYHRRDVRNEFKPDPLDPTVLERMLKAAHAAPSVGLSQPWRFILIRDPARRSKIKQAFERANAEAREMFSDNKKQEYAALKLEGIEKAPLNICVACERKGMKQTGGAIVNFSSISYMMGNAGYPAYTTANAGITGMTRSLARELGPHNIRINALAPGWVLTEKQLDQWATPEALRAHLERQCLKQHLEPRDIVDATLFLSSQASRMMTGQLMAVDGGVVHTG